MLAISQAAALKPEIRLQQALREYQSLLTKSQRQIFDARVRSGRPPDMADVIQATSEIDREARKQRGIHKCAAPRLMKVLTACQRFAAIGDVLIGGSQNLIACGVWSAVRLSLQISAGNGTFFDKLSLLIMEIGRTAPINEEIGLLVPDSPELQYLVAEYMLRVVSICKEMVKMSNRSSLAQLTSSISGFDTTFGQLSDETKTIGHVIDKQIALLSAKTNVLEARENQGSRALLRGLSSEARRQAREVKVVQFFKELCSHQRDFDAARANIRQKGTVDWIFKHPEYSKWKTVQSSCALNLVGKLGSGKSVAMANIVDDLHLKLPHSSSQEMHPAVAYMFYTHGLRQMCVARHMVGSLALQILRSSVLRPAVERFLEDRQLPDLLYPTVASIVSTSSSILRNLPSPPEIFIILDGLEECALEDLNEIALALCKWKADSNIHLVFSSRNAMDTFKRVCSLGIRITTLQNTDDLTTFISSETKRRGELCQRPPELWKLIAEVLSTGADGMYLWASLMLDLIFPTHLAQPSVLVIEDLLDELPQSLSEVYEKLLARVQDRERTRNLLQFITVACRPLSIGEVIDALSISPGTLAREKVVILAKPADLLIQLGGNLVYVEEEDETIHFIHDSALSHLIVEGRSTEFGFGVGEAQRYMGGVCTTYLNLPELNGSLQKTVLDSGSLTVTPNDLVANAVQTTLPRPVQKTVGSVLSRLSNRKSRQVDLTRIVNELVAWSPSPKHHIFRQYCKEFWLQHTKNSRTSAQTADRLWIQLMDDPGTLHLPWGLDKLDRLVWSLQQAHPSVLAYSIQDASEAGDRYFQFKTLEHIINHFTRETERSWSVYEGALFSSDSSRDGDILLLLIKLARVSTLLFAQLKRSEEQFSNLIHYLYDIGYSNTRHIGHAEAEIDFATPLGLACEAPDTGSRSFLVGLLLELKADPNALFLDRHHTVSLPLVYVIANHKDEAQNWRSGSAALLVQYGADVNSSTRSWPHCPLIATFRPSDQLETTQLVWLMRKRADPYVEVPGIGISVIKYLTTKSGLDRQSIIKILSIIFLYRQQGMSGLQAYTCLARLVAEFLDQEVTGFDCRENQWIDHSALVPLSLRQTLEIALQFDGVFLAEVGTYDSAHLKSLMDAYDKDPARAPTQSLMRQIYTHEGIPFSQQIRLVHLEGHFMDQFLHWIVAFGHVDTILELAQNQGLKKQILTCQFLLHRAVLTAHLTGNTDCLTALLELGREVDEIGPHHQETALFWAVWLRSHELVSLLIRHGARVGTTLWYASYWDGPRTTFGPTFRFNIDTNSYQIHDITHLDHQHVYRPHTHSRSTLRGLSPLLAAVLVKDSEMVCLLLEHHARIYNIERADEKLRRGWRQVVADGLLSKAAMTGLADMTPQSVSDPAAYSLSTSIHAELENLF